MRHTALKSWVVMMLFPFIVALVFAQVWFQPPPAHSPERPVPAQALADELGRPGP